MSRVLVINDSKFERLILSDILSQMGYNVMAADEYSALRQLGTFMPDIVFTNYIMKDVTGDKIIEAIKVKMPKAKCILTSSTHIEYKEINQKNIDAIIKTPVDRSKLEAALNDCEKQDINGMCRNEMDPVKSSLSSWKSRLNQEKTAKLVIQSVSVEKLNLQKIENERDGAQYSFCPYCGNELKDGFMFCPSCGKKI